jgi:hypothetical protein
MLKNTEDNTRIQQRVIVFLNRGQVDFLDKLGKDTLFSGKKKLPRTKIIEGLVNLLIDLDINGKEISSLDDLKQKIKEKIGINWPSTKELLIFKDRPDKNAVE